MIGELGMVNGEWEIDNHERSIAAGRAANGVGGGGMLMII